MAKKINKSAWDRLNWEKLPSPVIGVDEAGRGCLAGPVCAAAVILKDLSGIEDYTDSKLLSPDRRQYLAKDIMARQSFAIGFATRVEIDTINILQASLLAMKRAVLKLNVFYGTLLIDGKFIIPNFKEFDQIPLIKGELRATPIAAASIVAKVTRDQKMLTLAREYPSYGFDIHKGYATKRHKEAISQFGPCFQHRKTFAGVKEHITSMENR